eukprot:scaffold9598_cov149-Skeletonema_marinoi.AAC.2
MMMQDFCRFQFDNNTNSVYIPNMDTTYDTTALLAMLLGRVKRNILATIQRRKTGNTNNSEDNYDDELEFVFSVPPNYPQVTRQAVMDAAYAVKVNKSRVVDGASCLAAVYQRKFYTGLESNNNSNDHDDGDEEKNKKTVLVVEMGHSRSCVSILQCGGGGGGGGGGGYTKEESSSSSKEEEEALQNDIPSNNVQVLSTVSSATLGAAMIDIALFHHFQSNHPSLSHTTFTPKSRPAQRLMEGCRKLKHILSMLPEGNVTVETIGKNDMDVSLSGNRELLKQLCQESVANKLKSMIAAAVEKAGGIDVLGLGDIGSVEITGGGTRIPMIQDAVRHAIGKGEDFVLSKSLDDTSLAFGASLFPIDASTTNVEVDAEHEARRAQLLEEEMAMMERDVQM